MPVALVAPERHLTVAPVCGARTLAEGRPPMGIACAQQDVAHVYPLPDDPERCLEDFAERAAEHAHDLAERLEHQEALACGASWSSTAATTSTPRPAERRTARATAVAAAGRASPPAVIAAAVVVFLAISFVARPLADAPRTASATPSTRCSSTRPRGDAARRCSRRLDGCDGARCAATVAAERRAALRTARRARRSCASTRAPPTRSARSDGPTRVAWTRHQPSAARRPVRRRRARRQRRSPAAPLRLRSLSAPRSAARTPC